MDEKFTRWDAVDYLRTGADVALYVDTCQVEDPGGGLVPLVKGQKKGVNSALIVTSAPWATGKVKDDFSVGGN